VDSPELLDLNRALDELGELDMDKAQMVELRYFLGCTTEETAELMQVSKAKVDRDLKFARSWLYRRICPGAAAGLRGPEAFSGCFRNLCVVCPIVDRSVAGNGRGEGKVSASRSSLQSGSHGLPGGAGCAD